jgi:hypothetical protein
LRSTGQTVNGTTGTADADIDASEAWDLVNGHLDVIDAGADLEHPDLQGNILPRGTEDWDFADAHDPSPDDNDSYEALDNTSSGSLYTIAPFTDGISPAERLYEKGPRAIVRYSSRYEKTLPNGSL